MLFSRVKKMLDASSASVVLGGNLDEKSNYVSPTLLADVKPDDAVMQDEVCQIIMRFQLKGQLTPKLL